MPAFGVAWTTEGAEVRFRAELRIILERCRRFSVSRHIRIQQDNARITLRRNVDDPRALDSFAELAQLCYVHVTNLGVPGEQGRIRWVKLRFSAIRRTINACIGLLCTTLPASKLKNSLYRSMGITIGADVEISQGAFFDTFSPQMITIGDGTVVGAFAKLFTHVYRGKGRMFLGPIVIGRNCMISGTATIGPCIIEDNVTILPGVITIPFLRRVRAGAIIGFHQQPVDLTVAAADFPND
jgi:acetyltransferase-like isoleucine patch superfamily enzyme